MKRPLAIDLFCGLGGWTEGLLAEGYDVVGFDIEQHVYGEHRYPGMLAIQDVLTLHGSQFKNAAVIVASPPCQAYSYMAMPWTRAKAKAAWYRDVAHIERLIELNALFNACFRIQREASEAAGRRIPLIVENVKGAQPWVGRANWHYGSYYLWGDVPALMPTTLRRRKSHHVPIAEVPAGVGATSWFHGNSKHEARHYGAADTKNDGGSWFNVAHNTTSGHGRNPDGRKTVGHANRRDGHSHTRHLTNQSESDAVKVPGFSGPAWFDETGKSASKSPARKAASARIAKIPFALATHIAQVYYPREVAAA